MVIVKEHVLNETNDAQIPDTPGVPFALKATVIGLGVLLVVGLIVVFSTIIYRSVKLAGGGSVSQIEQNRADDEPFVLKIDPNSVNSVALDGSRLTIQARDEIIVYDIRRRQVIARIKLQPK